ncbi:MAG: hypothetical protein ACTHQ3_04565 [Motilibacteraceae bacterium]
MRMRPGDLVAALLLSLLLPPLGLAYDGVRIAQGRRSGLDRASWVWLIGVTVVAVWGTFSLVGFLTMRTTVSLDRGPR